MLCCCVSVCRFSSVPMDDCVMRNSQVESVAGAAYLPIDSAGVPRCAGCVQKSLVDQKKESLHDLLSHGQ